MRPSVMGLCTVRGVHGPVRVRNSSLSSTKVISLLQTKPGCDGVRGPSRLITPNAPLRSPDLSLMPLRSTFQP